MSLCIKVSSIYNIRCPKKGVGFKGLGMYNGIFGCMDYFGVGRFIATEGDHVELLNLTSMTVNPKVLTPLGTSQTWTSPDVGGLQMDPILHNLIISAPQNRPVLHDFHAA